MAQSHASPLDPILDVLACPNCRGGFQWQADGDTREDGGLHCAVCHIFTPVLSGVAFFGEIKKAEFDPRAVLAELRTRIGTEEDYRLYAEGKHARNVLEPYAAFAPFNESTRAALPLLYGARNHLPPNDLVLDLSNRSGWTGAYLAGLFPEQRVIAFWEGDSSVLGYRGFAHWFGASRKPQNLFPIFLPPAMSFPMRDGAARLVHGYDILHHRVIPEFLVETLRVAAENAVLVFPHIHLSNSEPDPWFARGGSHRHGRDYQALLDRHQTGSTRKPAVLSELSAFGAWMKEGESPDAFSPGPETAHYNGVIAVAPPSVLATSAISTRRAALSRSALFVSNPFLRVNPLTGRVHLLEDALAGHLRHMFDRHPAYESFLVHSIEDLSLSPGELAVIAAMEEGAALSRLGATSGLSEGEVEQHVARLTGADLVVPAPITKNAWRMQQGFHANGHSLFDRHAARVLHEWTLEAPQADAFPLMGVNLTRAEIGEISAALLHYLAHVCPRGNTLRIAVADGKIEAWLNLVAAAAGWDIGENANFAFVLRDGAELSITGKGNTASLVEIMEAYGGRDTEPAFPAMSVPAPRSLGGRGILRVAGALA